MALLVLPNNTGPGTTLSWPVIPGSSGLDLTTVSGCFFNVKRPDGSTTTWAGTIASGTTKWALTAQHAFLTGDLAMVGMYGVQVILNIPGGTAPVYPPRPIRVVPFYQE